jgi:hypothetical protein
MAQAKHKSKDRLGLQQKNELLAIMDSLFPDQDLLNDGSRFRKKVDFTFELMQKQEWSKQEFEKTLLEFSMNWPYNTWMPANILEFKNKLFSHENMVL